MSAYQKPDDGTAGGDAPSGPQDAVGYKQPPFHSRFKSGKSGNSKGRPKGRPNVATIVKAIFNQPIPVRTGDKTRRMPAVEAIVRSLTAKACQADEKALFALMQIVEMTGRTDDINDDERRTRAMHLPSSFSPEEHDLLLAEAREKERQTYRAKAEADPARYATSADGTPSALIIPPAIEAGDELAAACKFDNALLAYRREVARCKAQLVANDGDKQALDDFRRVVGRIVLAGKKFAISGHVDIKIGGELQQAPAEVPKHPNREFSVAVQGAARANFGKKQEDCSVDRWFGKEKISTLLRTTNPD